MSNTDDSNSEGPDHENDPKQERLQAVSSADEHAKPNAHDYAPNRRNNKRHWLEYATAIGAVVAAIGAIAAAGLGGWQDIIARGTYKTVRDQERRQLRSYAYVAPQPYTVGSEEGPIANIGFLGQSPAYKVIGLIYANVGLWPMGSEDNITKAVNGDALDKDQRSVTIGTSAEGVTLGPAPLPAMSDTTKTLIKDADTYRLYVFGKVSYQDIFGQSHWLTFCYAFAPVTKSSGSTNPTANCPRGNDVDYEEQR